MIQRAGWNLSLLSSAGGQPARQRVGGWLERFEQILERSFAARHASGARGTREVPAARSYPATTYAARTVSTSSTDRNPLTPAVPAAWLPTAPSASEAAPQTTSTELELHWETEVTGTAPDGTRCSYNPRHFATAETADQLAEMLGGEVVEVNLGDVFSRSAPERLIVVGEARLNAGLVADLYSKHPKEVADQMVADTIARHNT
jgi:hypothetical protein